MSLNSPKVGIPSSCWIALELTIFAAGAIIPVVNHGLPCMSMGFLLPKAPGTDSSADTAVVWRGLMVQKAVQQLLFDVDWRDPVSGAELDALVIDMPPGTGDVPLTLGQLVNVDGKHVVEISVGSSQCNHGLPTTQAP